MKRGRVPEWRHIPFLGTELTSRDEVIKQPFEFPSLESIINKNLRGSPSRKAFLWASTQPIQLDDIVTIPVILICFCDTMLPPLVCVHSTQSSTDEIINLKDRGDKSIDWTPYSPRVFFLPVEGQGPPGFPTTKPRATPPPPPPPSIDGEIAPPVLAEGELNLVFTDPYIVRPQQLEDLKKERTKLVNYKHIPFEFEFKGRTFNDYYVKTSSTTLDEYLQESVEDNNIEEADAEEYKKLVRESMEKSREQKIKEVDERIEMIEKTDPAIKEAEIIKVYPRHPHLDLSKSYSKKINSVLKDADEVIGEKGPRARLREKNIKRSVLSGNTIYGLPKILEDYERQKKEEIEEIEKEKEEMMKEAVERKKRKREDKAEGDASEAPKVPKVTKKRKMKRKLRYSKL